MFLSNAFISTISDNFESKFVNINSFENLFLKSLNVFFLFLHFNKI